MKVVKFALEDYRRAGGDTERFHQLMAARGATKRNAQNYLSGIKTLNEPTSQSVRAQIMRAVVKDNGASTPKQLIDRMVEIYQYPRQSVARYVSFARAIGGIDAKLFGSKYGTKNDRIRIIRQVFEEFDGKYEPSVVVEKMAEKMGWKHSTARSYWYRCVNNTYRA